LLLILFVKINVILKGIPFREPQYTSVGGYTRKKAKKKTGVYLILTSILRFYFLYAHQMVIILP
jgi:hypothetical protein